MVPTWSEESQTRHLLQTGPGLWVCPPVEEYIFDLDLKEFPQIKCQVTLDCTQKY